MQGQSTRKIAGSRAGPYFELFELPFKPVGYQFVGQGARALAFAPEFCERVLQKKVTNWWDIHLLSEASKVYEEHIKKGKKRPLTAILATPAMFHHRPAMGDRFRGSGRLHAAADPGEPQAKYICLQLDRQWGLTNRLQTIALMAAYCHMHR